MMITKNLNDDKKSNKNETSMTSSYRIGTNREKEIKTRSTSTMTPPPQDNVTTKRVDKKSLGLNRSAWQPIELNLWPKVGEFRKTWKWKFDNYNCKWSVQPKSLKKEVLPKNDYLFTWSVVGERNAPRKLYLHRRISHGTFKKFQNILWSVKI